MNDIEKIFFENLRILKKETFVNPFFTYIQHILKYRLAGSLMLYK
ncbi:MAG: hypothetical protein RL619_678 [Bacteroidota bacterium]